MYTYLFKKDIARSLVVTVEETRGWDSYIARGGVAVFNTLPRTFIADPPLIPTVVLNYGMNPNVCNVLV